MEYCEPIGSKCLFGTVYSWVENHDFSTVLFNQELYNLSAESGESVPMGNNNLELISSHNTLQYGLKPFSFEIDAASVVFDDFCRWEFATHGLNPDLSGSVGLSFSTNSTVANGSNI